MKARRNSERGQELVEFALVLPLLLLLLLGIIEFGIVIFKYNTIANIGREIARYGTVHPRAATIEGYIDEELERWTIGLPPDTLDITFVLTAGGTLESTIEVSVAHEHRLLSGPLIRAVGGKSILTLQSVSRMYTEAPVRNE